MHLNMKFPATRCVATATIAMRGIIKVVTPDEFVLWRAKQKPKYTRCSEAERSCSSQSGNSRHYAEQQWLQSNTVSGSKTLN